MRREEFKLAWVIDFPSFTWDEEEQRWAPITPFTRPDGRGSGETGERPWSVRAKAYDLVCNGYEVGAAAFVSTIAACSRGCSDGSAGRGAGPAAFRLPPRRLQFGAPPHGGVALGLDRWTMILAGTATSAT